MKCTAPMIAPKVLSAERTVMPLFKYRDLTDKLRQSLRGMVAGSPLPSQNELMRQYRVSNRTVRRSLEELCGERLLVARNNGKTFAVADPMMQTPKEPLKGSIVVLSLMHNPFFQHCVDTLVAEGTRRGLNIFCQYATNGNVDGIDALAIADMKPDGFMMFSYRFEPVAERLQDAGHRVVIVGMPPVDTVPTLPCVSGDQKHGGFLAANHLLSLGHRRVGFLHVFPDNEKFKNTRRWRGYAQALDAAGIAVNDDFLWNGQNGRDFLAEPERFTAVLNHPDAPTAYCAWTDSEATDWLLLFEGAGKKVPADISLIGYDGLLIGSLLDPPLTTVDAHIATQVGFALDLLLTDASRPAVPFVSVTPNLVVRASCAPPPTRVSGAVQKAGIKSHSTDPKGTQ